MRVGRTYLIGAALLSAQTAAAAPLDPAACTDLKTERQGLITAGAKSDMEKGPDWAKTNLAPDRLGKIERLIAVEEQLSFRCGELVTARPAMKEQPKPDAEAAKDNTGAQAQAAPPDALNALGLDTGPEPKKKKKSASKSKSKDAKSASGAE
jgi:hypothetical protein